MLNFAFAASVFRYKKTNQHFHAPYELNKSTD